MFLICICIIKKKIGGLWHRLGPTLLKKVSGQLGMFKRKNYYPLFKRKNYYPQTDFMRIVSIMLIIFIYCYIVL